jgi:hypothetical protein
MAGVGLEQDEAGRRDFERQAKKRRQQQDRGKGREIDDILQVNLSRLAFEQSNGVDLDGNKVARQANLDTPSLLFQFQLNANLQQEAEISFATEILKQLNALITTYSNMQQMVNDTSKAAGDDAKGYYGLVNNTKTADAASVILPFPKDGTASPVNLFDSIAVMFDKNSRSQPHPLELLFSVSRPLQELVSPAGDTPATRIYKGMQKSQMTTFGDQLSSAVTQLNQQVQILTDRINSQTKQKDRHFDLGNDALRKMADMIQEIGRGVAG